MIIWLFGQPGSGKTTIAKEVTEKLAPQFINVDGDEIREMNKDDNYTAEGRFANIRRAITIVKFLKHINFNVVVSMVTPYKKMRAEIKEQLPEVIFVRLFYNSDRDKNDFFVKDFEDGLEISFNTDLSTPTSIVNYFYDILAL